MLDPKDPLNETLMRMFLGCLLFRLGGEQKFSPAEIDDIRTSVQGVQFFATEDGSIILRTRGAEFVEKAMVPGKGIIL